jgi:hypothetical protein
MDDGTPAEVVDLWRDTTLAADLVDRLTIAAVDVAEQAERNAAALEEVASLAEQAARSAERAAIRARRAAGHARELADDRRANSARADANPLTWNRAVDDSSAGNQRS